MPLELHNVDTAYQQIIFYVNIVDFFRATIASVAPDTPRPSGNFSLVNLICRHVFITHALPKSLFIDAVVKIGGPNETERTPSENSHNKAAMNF